MTRVPVWTEHAEEIASCSRGDVLPCRLGAHHHAAHRRQVLIVAEGAIQGLQLVLHYWLLLLRVASLG